MPGADEILEDRYRIQRPLGKGGMGEVFLAEDQTLDRAVAIKLLVPELKGDLRAVDLIWPHS